jgi:hypothetical protein
MAMFSVLAPEVDIVHKRSNDEHSLTQGLPDNAASKWFAHARSPVKRENLRTRRIQNPMGLVDL